MDTNKSWFSVPMSIVLAAVMISGAILYASSGGVASLFDTLRAPNPTASNGPIVVKDPKSLFGPTDPSLGDQNAKVTIVEFSDFQCPYCRQFFVETFSQLKQAYVDTGKVRFIYRNFPLSQVHPAAQPSALAADCANDQGKFWEYHDKIFAEQQKREPNPAVVSKTITFNEADLKTWASQIGLDMSQFNQCLAGQTHAADVQADLKAGTSAGVTGTPSFFVNGKLVVGALEFSDFQDLIETALQK